MHIDHVKRVSPGYDSGEELPNLSPGDVSNKPINKLTDIHSSN